MTFDAPIASQVIEKFREDMARNGVPTSDTIIADGRFHRCNVDGDKRGRKNGWYVLHLDDRPAGAYGCNKRFGNDHRFVWSMKLTQTMTLPEREALREKHRLEKERREQEKREAEKKAAARAQAIVGHAQPASDDHPYLQRKQVKSFGLLQGAWTYWDREAQAERRIDNCLLIPMRTADRAIVSLQAIFPGKDDYLQRDKDYLPKGQRKGTYFAIVSEGCDTSTIVVCEGYATGASIHMATGYVVLVAFDAGNLLPVAQLAREAYPEATLFLAADNDQWTLRPVKNPGLVHAAEATNVVHGVLAVPQFHDLDAEDENDRPTDFNDMHVRYGLEAVRDTFALALHPVQEALAQEQQQDQDAYQDYVDQGDDYQDEEAAFHAPAAAPGAAPAPAPGDGKANLLEQRGNPYFRLLGYRKTEDNKTEYLFFQKQTKLVIGLAATQFSKSNLIALAPLNYWEIEYPGPKGGVNTDMAANELIRRCESVFFSDKVFRGRGAWWNPRDKSVVVHLGDKLVINGEQAALGQAADGHIYEIGEPLNLAIDSPLPANEAVKLVKLCEMLHWDRPVNAKLLAGFVALAPICGALWWRPHIWVTGGAGTGKSWVFKYIVRELLGECALAVQSSTSEAGIRQLLGTSALPVVFDEAEGEDKMAQERMQNVMGLMRAASSEDGGVIGKGTTSGQAMKYVIKSMFAFASIADQIQQKADADRITVLSLVKWADTEKETRFEQLLRYYTENITPAFIAGLQARVIRMVPVILENARIFSRAAASVLGTARAGDQIGTLLAGAYALHSDRVIDFDKAVDFVRAQDWEQERSIVENKDELLCFNRIMETMVKVEGDRTVVERTVGELVQTAVGLSDDLAISDKHAIGRLLRFGVKIDGDGILISNTSDAIKQRLAGTPWAKAHNKVLKRIEGAVEVHPQKFAGTSARSVRVPLSLITTELPRPI